MVFRPILSLNVLLLCLSFLQCEIHTQTQDCEVYIFPNQPCSVANLNLLSRLFSNWQAGKYWRCNFVHIQSVAPSIFCLQVEIFFHSFAIDLQSLAYLTTETSAQHTWNRLSNCAILLDSNLRSSSASRFPCLILPICPFQTFTISTNAAFPFQKYTGIASVVRLFIPTKSSVPFSFNAFPRVILVLESISQINQV